MRPIEHFLTDLGGREITLRREGDRLVVQAPTGAMTPSLAAKIRANKSQILAYLDSVGRQKETIPVASPDAVPLMSPAQQRLWFLDQFEGAERTAASTYHIHAGLNLHGELHQEALRRAVARLVKRHASLRTSFCEREGQLLQIVHANVEAEIVQATMAGESEETVQAWIANQTARPFDLTEDPLLRLILVKRADNEHVLQIVMHHIVSDGWSMGILVRELIGFYQEETDGTSFILPELAIQYSDYAIWQHQPEVEAAVAQQVEWWQSQLANLPAQHQLPTDMPRPKVQTHRGAVYTFKVEKTLLDGLEHLAKNRGATLFMALLACFKTLVARYSDQDDIAVGSPVANRNRGEIEPLIGFFVNTLVLRSKVNLKASFLDVLATVRETTLQAFAHQDTPFEKVVEALKPDRNLSYSPLFQLMFSLQTNRQPNLDIPGLRVSLRESEVTTAKFDLTFDATPSEDGLYGAFEYNTDLFLPGTIADMAGHLTRLMAQIVQNPERPLLDHPLMSSDQEASVRATLETKPADYSLAKPVHRFFEAMAEAHPHRTALMFEGEPGEMTYGELNRQANRIAWRLIAMGIGPEDRVAFSMHRSWEMVAGVLAVFKTGAAYVPIDPEMPQTRIDTMLRQAEPKLILTQTALKAALPGKQTLCLDDDAAFSDRDHNPEIAVDPGQAAYLIFTSGSTGEPKASINTHRGLVNHNQWIQSQFPLGESDRVALKTPFSFDVWAKECLWPLSFGATVAIARPGTEGDPFYLRDWIAAEGITTVYFVASLLRAFLDSFGQDEYRSRLRYVFCGGETLAPDVQQRALQLLRDERGPLEIHNTYGPSETAITCMFHSCGKAPCRRPIPLGRPIANMNGFVVDTRLRPVPQGLPGELAIAGANLGRGYLNRPGKTAARFVPNPFQDGERLYLTGDRVRLDHDGALQFLGRIDHQFKLRGIRIELGDIESQLRKLPGVEAAVAVVGPGKSGEAMLAAFVQGEPALTPGTGIRDWLAQHLPAAMVPATVTTMATLPRLASGKIDRASLTRKVADLEIERQPPVAPRNPLETTIAVIWQEVLGLENPGVHDHFFELGGHSLLATQIISRMRLALDVEMPLKPFFANPTIAATANWINAQGRDRVQLPALKPMPRGEHDIELSFAQQRLWFLDRMLAGKARHRGAYHIHAALQLDGPLDEAALTLALQQLGERHESLRTIFKDRHGKPIQVIQAKSGLQLEVQHQADAGEEAIREAIAAKIQVPFDLASDPLLRLTLLHLTPKRHILILTMHHIVSDGWSMGILVRELLALYRQAAGGPAADLPELAVQYADFALWQRQPEVLAALDRQAAWWEEALAQLPPVHQLPTDRPRPAVQTYRGARIEKTIPSETAAAAGKLAEASGATLFMLLLAAFKVLLARYSGEGDTVVGSPVANRNRADIEPLIGFFANTLVFRDQVDDRQDFQSFLNRVKHNALACYANQDVPFEQVVERVKPERSLSHAPLFQIMFSMQNTARPDIEVEGLNFKPLEMAATTAKFDLTLDAGTNADGLQTAWEYNSDLFDESTILTMADHFCRLLDAVTTNPTSPIGSLSILDRATEARLIRAYNDTQSNTFQTEPVHTLFEAKAAAHPQRTALVSAASEEPITYEDLNGDANRLAWQLRDMGIDRETRVAILVRRSPTMVTTMLAVLKAGAAYVPLDPEAPVSRTAAMLADSGAGLLLTQSHQDTSFATVPRVNLDDPSSFSNRRDNLNLPIDLDQAAYLVYTSGSTGAPKASINTHRGLANHNLWLQREFPLNADDRMAVKTPMTFDVAAWETLWPLMAGASLAIAEPGAHGDPFYLQAWIQDRKITCVYFVASMLRSFLESLPEGSYEAPLRLLFTGGEPIKPDLVNLVRQKIRGQRGPIQLHNTYGPSEAAISCTSFTPNDQPQTQPIPIGKPIANTCAYVVDGGLRLQPPGIPGELLIGGANVSRGYHRRASLTAAKFVPDPFATGLGGQRLYRTGDRVRMRPDGELLFLDRIDGQVKLRGLRIELGDIESHLDRHDSVLSSQVVMGRNQSGSPILVAYLQMAEHADPVTSSDLRTWLGQHLPGYMVPSSFVPVTVWPRLSNGKIDRGNLARRPVQFGQSDEFTEPQTLVEKKLAEIWCEVLGIEKVGRNDNFFHLGGHSLLATQVLSRIRDVFQAEIPLQNLFAEPTIAELSRSVTSESNRTPLPPIRRRPPSGEPPPLSFAQQRLWFLDQFMDRDEESLGNYHLHSAFEVRGELDAEALQRALTRMGQRHETLRTRFQEIDGKPKQIIDDEPNLALRRMRVPHLEEAERQKLLAVEAARYFDLAHDPLLRLTLIESDEDNPFLLFTMHHIISDGWSMGIFVQELVALYREESGHETANLPSLELQYADFSAWQQSEAVLTELDRQAQWWKTELAGLPLVHQLQTDRPRPAVQTYRGRTHTITIPKPTLARLNQLAKETDTTLFMVLLAGFKALLARYSGQNDIVIGTPIANRNRRDIEPLIGFFVNTLVLRSQVDGQAPYRDLLDQVKTTTLGAYAHQDVPFEHVVDLLKPPRHLSHSPLFQIMFSLQNAPTRGFELPDLAFHPLAAEVQAAKFDITLDTEATADGLLTAWNFNADLFDPETIATMANHFGNLLAAIADNPAHAIADLDLLGEAERHKLRTTFNQTAKGFPLETPIHAWVEAHAEAHPNRVAVILDDAGETMTYEALNRRANQIAWRLIEHGIGPDTRVALFLDRCGDMIAAIFGILKTGAAYLPIDPEYPETRIAFMLEDGDPDLVLTHADLAEDLEHGSVLRLDRDEAYAERTDNPNLAVDSLTSAYMIYTSGSTGRPKSSLNSHRGLSNHIHWLQDRFQLQPQDRVAQKTPFSFDVSARETFWPLMAGASLVLAAPGTSGDPYYLQDWIRDQNITVIYFVGSMLQTFLESLEGERYQSNLRLLFTGGETLPPESQRQILEQMIGQDGPLETHVTYGPSEAAISCTHHACGLEPRFDPLPIGRPIPNMAGYVVDATCRLVPLGVPGELMISGENLSHGYHRRASLTAERFLPNPFAEAPGTRMYRTGDLVRFRPNGDIVFLGRIDGQIKLRGMRIELGEIERRLADHEAVAQALVMMAANTTGEPMLLAFYQHKGETDPGLARSLWAFLAESLPAFMVPGKFTGLTEWPRLPNGKIDRKALRELAFGHGEDTGQETREHVSPRNPIETALAEIWCDVLGLEKVGVFDNFFEVGGHSLLATQVLARMREAFPERLSLRYLFAEPTIAGIATGIENIRKSTSQQAPEDDDSREVLEY